MITCSVINNSYQWSMHDVIIYFKFIQACSELSCDYVLLIMAFISLTASD